MRIVVALVLLVLLACAMLASHNRRSFLLRIDAQSPGAWATYAAASPAAPHMLFAPCPLAPQNVPRQRPKIEDV